jgi:MFS family permease
VTGANLIQALSISGMFGVFFLGTLYLQRILGYSALEIGVAFLPTTIAMGTMSVRYSERLVMRFGARRTLFPGLALILAGLLLFARVPVDGSYLTDVFPMCVLLGIGAGTCFPALMNLAMSDSTPQDAGLASGLVNTTAQVGAALGLAVLATLSASHTEGLLGDGEAAAAALTGGYRFAFWIAAGLVAAAIVVALTVLKPDAEPAEHAEHADRRERAEIDGSQAACEAA